MYYCEEYHRPVFEFLQSIAVDGVTPHVDVSDHDLTGHGPGSMAVIGAALELEEKGVIVRFDQIHRRKNEPGWSRWRYRILKTEWEEND